MGVYEVQKKHMYNIYIRQQKKKKEKNSENYKFSFVDW